MIDRTNPYGHTYELEWSENYGSFPQVQSAIGE